MSKPEDPLSPELPDEKVISLKKPLVLGEQTWHQIILREPSGDEMREIRRRAPLDQQIAAIALISGIPEQVVGKAPISKLEEGEAYLVGFTNAARKIGGA